MLYAFPEEQGSYGSIIAFRPRSYPYDKLQQLFLEKYKIVTRVVPENGINCNRISTRIYNTQEEMDRLVAAVTSVVQECTQSPAECRTRGSVRQCEVIFTAKTARHESSRSS